MPFLTLKYHLKVKGKQKRLLSVNNRSSKSNSNNSKISYLRSRGITIPKRIQVSL